jgi:hypothetical protein
MPAFRIGRKSCPKIPIALHRFPPWRAGTVSNLFRINKIICVGFVLLNSIYSLAQDPSAGSNGGAPPAAVLHGSDIESVQVNNGNLMIKIPFDSTPGRGLSAGHLLIYNSKGYYMSQTCTGSTCNFFVKPSRSNQLIAKMILSSGYSVGGSSYKTSCDGGVTNISITGSYAVVDPDGTVHHMVPDPQGAWGCQISTNATRYADDGSGWVLQPGNPSKAFRKDGLVSSSDSVNSAKDTNGNQISSTSDTFNRSIPSGYYDASGTLRQLSITSVSLSASTHLCFTPVAPSQCTEDTTLLGNAPSQITLPNGLSYSFQYSGSDITSLTLPSGAVISYTYTTFAGDYSGSRVATRTVTTNGQPARWTYTYAEPSPDVFTTTVLDPFGNQTVYTCLPIGSGVVPPPDTVPGKPSCQVTDVSFYSGTSALMKTVHTDYWNGLASVPKAVTTTIYSAITGDSSLTKTRVETDYDGQTLTFPGEQDLFTRANVIEQREFIYDGAGNNPQLVRKTDYMYLH